MVERLERGEEPRDLLIPRKRCRVVPDLPAFREMERPVEEIAHVREDLPGRARPGCDREMLEAGGRAAQRLARAVGKRRERVAEEVAGGGGRRHEGGVCRKSFTPAHARCARPFPRSRRATSAG